MRDRLPSERRTSNGRSSSTSAPSVCSTGNARDRVTAPPVTYSLSRHSPTASGAAAASSSAPGRRARSAGRAAAGRRPPRRPGRSPCSPRRRRRRSGTAHRRCPGPRRRRRRPRRPAGPPRCGWCRAAPWSAPAGPARPAFAGSVLTVKCTAASRESPTRAVYRMPVPLNVSSRICCIASRQSVVYRSRGRYTITETNRPNGSGCRKARSRRRLASCSTLPTTSTTRSGSAQNSSARG